MFQYGSVDFSSYHSPPSALPRKAYSAVVGFEFTSLHMSTILENGAACYIQHGAFCDLQPGVTRASRFARAIVKAQVLCNPLPPWISEFIKTIEAESSAHYVLYKRVGNRSWCCHVLVFCVRPLVGRFTRIIRDFARTDS